MALLSEIITNENLFEFFPEQCFPDLDSLQLRIDEQSLHISCEDSEWPLQSDIALAMGPGRMSFFYSGELSFQINGPDGKQDISMREERWSPLFGQETAVS